MSTRIMIIDDEPAIGKLLVHQLTMLGYKASHYVDGILALERFEAEQPDLVLLDVMMPTISGWDVCRQLRSFSSVPVMMLTAKSAEPDVIAGLSAGADDYLSKPFTIPELQARISAVLRRRSERPATPRGNDVPSLPARRERAAVGSDAQLQPASHTSPINPARALPEQSQRLGAQLRAARLARGATLSEAAAAVHVRWEYLQAIEQENFSYVPRPQLRLALPAYSAYLGVQLPTATGKPIRATANTTRRNQTFVIVLLLILILLVTAAIALLLISGG